jgi:hypothetical protein
MQRTEASGGAALGWDAEAKQVVEHADGAEKRGAGQCLREFVAMRVEAIAAQQLQDARFIRARRRERGGEQREVALAQMSKERVAAKCASGQSWLQSVTREGVQRRTGEGAERPTRASAATAGLTAPAGATGGGTSSIRDSPAPSPPSVQRQDS